MRYVKVFSKPTALFEVLSRKEVERSRVCIYIGEEQRSLLGPRTRIAGSLGKRDRDCARSTSVRGAR